MTLIWFLWSRSFRKKNMISFRYIYHFSFCGWAAEAHSIIHPISRHSAPHFIRMCSGGGFHHKAPCSTKLLLQTRLCQTDTIEIWKQKWSPFLCQTKQVGLIVENNFFLNPEAYSDQWTDWSDTFFYQSWGKNQAMLGVPHFHPITFEAPLTRAPVLGSPPH